MKSLSLALTPVELWNTCGTVEHLFCKAMPIHKDDLLATASVYSGKWKHMDTSEFASANSGNINHFCSIAADK